MNQKKINIFSEAWKKRYFIGTVVFITTLSSIGISFLIPKWYRATSTIVTSSSGSSIFGSMGALATIGIGDLLGNNDNQFRFISILKSRTLLDHIINKYDLKTKYNCKTMRDTRLKLKKNLLIDIGDEYQINVTLYDRDQDQVADIVNYVIYCLDSLNIALNTNDAHNARVFIEQRVFEVLDSLQILERDIINFMERNKVLNLEAQVSALVTQAAELKGQILLKEIEYAVAKKSLNQDNPQLDRLKTELKALKDSYNDFLTIDNKLYPDFKQIPYIGITISKLERKVEYYTTVLGYLGPQYEKAKIDEKRDIPTFQILDKAVRPELKARPKKSKIVLAVFFSSLIICIYGVYIKEKLSRDKIV